MRRRGSHYRDAAGLRRVDRGVAAVLVLVLAACGQAPQVPNRASLPPLPGENLKH